MPHERELTADETALWARWGGFRRLFARAGQARLFTSNSAHCGRLSARSEDGGPIAEAGRGLRYSLRKRDRVREEVGGFAGDKSSGNSHPSEQRPLAGGPARE